MSKRPSASKSATCNEPDWDAARSTRVKLLRASLKKTATPLEVSTAMSGAPSLSKSAVRNENGRSPGAATVFTSNVGFAASDNVDKKRTSNTGRAGRRVGRIPHLQRNGIDFCVKQLACWLGWQQPE